MALDQLNTPTVKPPTSLDLIGQEAASPTSVQTLGQSPTQQTALGSAVGNYAMQQMASPSRYDAGVVKQGIDLINQELARSQTEGVNAMDEFYSSRGLVGSSVESKGRGDFLAQLDQTKNQRMFDLVREMANTYGADVQAAGSLGLGARSQELQAMGMNADDAYRYAVLEQSGSQFQQELGQRQTEFGGQMGLSQQELDLRAQQIQQEAALQGRALTIEEARQRAQVEQYYAGLGQEERQFQQQLGQRESEFARSYNLDQGQLQLERDRLLQQAQLEGRSLDIQEATSQAEIEMRAQQLQQQAQLEGRSLDIEEARLQAQENQFDTSMQMQREQFAQQMGLSLQELSDQRDRFVAEYADRANQRLHEAGLQESSQEFQRAQNELNRVLEYQALQLQEAGLSAEVAWREADRLQQLTLESRALSLQEQGMEYDEAYRRAIADQQAYLSSQDIYLRALVAGAGDYANIPDIWGGTPRLEEKNKTQTIAYDGAGGIQNPYILF